MNDTGDGIMQQVEEVGSSVHTNNIAQANLPSDTEISQAINDEDPLGIGLHDQTHDYLNIQSTEEVIAGTSDRGSLVNGVDIPETNDVDIPLLNDKDSYANTRPYPCDFCIQRFRSKANLMNHMVAHQTKHPHLCNFCGARYVRKCDLINHLKIHADFSNTSDDSPKCPLPFISLLDDDDDGDDEEEEEEEEEEAPLKYPCGFCPHKFRLKRNLNCHIAAHLSLRPYLCKLCGARYEHESDLTEHSEFHTDADSLQDDFNNKDLGAFEDALYHL